MSTSKNVQTPTEAPLVSPSSEGAPADSNAIDNGKVQMKKQLGLVEGTAIILGIIFGSGWNETDYLIAWKKRKIKKSNCIFYLHFYRYFRITKRSHSRSQCRWNITAYMGHMWLFVNGWCAVLRWIGNIDSSIRRWLCVHQWSLWRFFLISLSLGCFIHFCVSFYFPQKKRHNPIV